MAEDPQDPGTGPAEQPTTQEPPEPPSPAAHPEPFGTENVEEGDHSRDE
jgi:hypothetical protein